MAEAIYVKDGKAFVKHDQGKLEWSLLPWAAVKEIVKVLMFGAKKYSRDNWKKADRWSTYYDACLRHLTDWWQRDPCDKESRLSHLAHAGCNICFLLMFELLGLSRDDRPEETVTPPPTVEPHTTVEPHL